MADIPPSPSSIVRGPVCYIACTYDCKFRCLCGIETWQCEILWFHKVINEDVWWDITPLNSNLFPKFRSSLLLQNSGHYYSSAPLQMDAISSSETSVRITNQHGVIPQKTLVVTNKQGWNNMAHSISNIVVLSILSILLVWVYIYGLKYKEQFHGPMWLKIGTVPQLLEKSTVLNFK